MTIAVVRHFIRVLPVPIALLLLRRLATRIQSPPVDKVQQEAMALATRLQYGTHHNTAWSWGTGPLVILTHGWGGRAAQLAPLAVTIASQGFRCVALDVSGHGDSPGNHSSWRHFIDDIAALSSELGGSVFAYIGHSAGGLATMAARAVKGVDAERFICICAPSHPYPPIRRIQETLNPPSRIIDAYREHLADQFETTWTLLEAGHAFAAVDRKLLLYYDEKDRFVDHSEGDRIQRQCPHARLIKSHAYGHTRILATTELASGILAFLESQSCSSQSTVMDSSNTAANK